MTKYFRSHKPEHAPKFGQVTQVDPFHYRVMTRWIYKTIADKCVSALSVRNEIYLSMSMPRHYVLYVRNAPSILECPMAWSPKSRPESFADLLMLVVRLVMTVNAIILAGFSVWFTWRVLANGGTLLNRYLFVFD